MFNTYQCQACHQHSFPLQAVCPACYSEQLQPQPDEYGVVINYTVDQRTGRVLTVIRTKHNVMVITESPHIIPLGTNAYIYKEKNKIISISLEETFDEKST